MKVRVEALVDGDQEASVRLAEAVGSDVAKNVGPVERVSAPSTDSRAFGITDLTAFFVALPPTLHALKSLISVVQQWASGPTRTVVLEIGDDKIEITGASAAQQANLVDAWIQRQIEQ